MMAMLVSVCIMAQAPQKFNYQAIVRNSQGELIVNSPVSVSINILKGSVSGQIVYAESHRPTTNGNGIFTISIGDGTVISSDMSAINWAEGPYYIRTDIDPTGGQNYTVTSTQQFMSVPYALYAEKAANAATIGYVDSAVATMAMTGGVSVVYDGVIDTTGCDTVIYNGYPFINSTRFLDYKDVAGLLHLLNVNVTVNRTVYQDTVVPYLGTPFTWHGSTCSQPGYYTWSTIATNGCDSIERLALIASNYINFGDTSWVSNNVVATTIWENMCVISAGVDDNSTVPYLVMGVNMNVGTYFGWGGPGDYSNQGSIWIDYYEHGEVTVAESQYGDWRLVEGYINITSIDMIARRFSCTVTATMYSLTDVQNGLDASLVRTRQLTASFQNVYISDGE